MKVKHPKFQFLNENPTLKEVFEESKKLENNTLAEDNFSNYMFFLSDLLDFNV